MPKEGSAKASWADCKPRERNFIDFYLGEAKGDPVQAATLARYKAPAQVGRRLERRLRQVIDSKLVEREADAIITTRGVIERFSWLADHAQVEGNRIKALEALARIHGLYSDTRIQINIGEAKAQVMDVLAALKGIKPLDAQVVHEPGQGQPEPTQVVDAQELDGPS